jgi:predicted dehydrogenase
MKPVCCGLTGFGGIAEGRFAPEGFALDRARFSPLDEVALLAATSRSDTRRERAESMGIRWYDSVDEPVAYRDIDAVFVASDNLNHHQHGIAEIRAGKHLLLDKRITTSIAEAQELKEEARSRGLSLGINHMMVHNVLNQESQRLVEHETIGTVSDVALHFEFGYGQTPEERGS